MGRLTENSKLLSQRIFEQLEVDITTRVYPPGAHLAEDDIAAQLGVSRTPVREAFRMLQRAGWLEIVPHAGARVRSPSMEEVRQVFEVRQCLEKRAAELAANRANDAHKRALGKIIEKGRRQVDRGNVKEVAALNSEFHSVIAHAGGNAILAEMLEDLGKQVRWHFASVAMVRGADSWREHEEILQAIEDGDPASAGQLAVDHSRRTQEAFFLHFLRGQDRDSGQALSDRAATGGP